MSEPGVDFDAALGAAYVRVNARNVYRTIGVGHGVNLDLDRTGNLVGVEVLWIGTDADRFVASIASEQAERWSGALTAMGYGVDDPRIDDEDGTTVVRGWH